MAYESKVMVFHVTTLKTDLVVGSEVAEVAMGAMGYDNGWKELFKAPVRYEVWNEYGRVETDCYGETLKACPIADVIAWLEKEMAKEGTAYRRLSVLLGLLKGFVPEEWGELEVVHYGY